MKCSICNKEIVLFPSAEHRARVHGGKPSDYTNLFTAHASCQTKKRHEDTLKLIERNRLKNSKCSD